MSRTLLLVALFYAPLAYGSTRPALVDFLDDGLLLCFGLHLAGLTREKRLPRYPVIPSICLGLLVLQAWWMWFNARSLLDDSFWEFVPLNQGFPNMPGSWDRTATLFSLKTLCAISGAFFVTSDLMADPVWKRRLWRAVGIAGSSVVAYGLILKGLGTDSMLALYTDPTSFGPYRYHANAGAYLNLIWPALLALLIESWRKRQAYLEQTIWACALLMGLAACFVNTSRAAAAISVLMLLTAGFSFSGFFQGHFIRLSRISRLLATVSLLTLVLILGYGGITNQLQGRWSKTIDTGQLDHARYLVEAACLRMIPDAGWFGFGPGTFSSVFPFHTQYLGDQIQGFWVYAHEDYLQTVIEYGYVGTALWSLFFFGSIFIGIRRGFQSNRRTYDRIVYRASWLALAGLALHSLVDFPLQVASIQLYATIFIAAAWCDSVESNRPRHSSEQIGPN